MGPLFILHMGKLRLAELNRHSKTLEELGVGGQPWAQDLYPEQRGPLLRGMLSTVWLYGGSHEVLLMGDFNILELGILSG